jgi:hypothetical protein
MIAGIAAGTDGARYAKKICNDTKFTTEKFKGELSHSSRRLILRERV